jgi:hypothetical protein
MNAMRTEPPRRRWRGWLIGLLILLPLLWIGYWFTVQQAASAAIERVTTGPIAGGRFTCGEKSLGGFPLRLDFACPRANFARGSAGGPDAVAVALGGLSVSAPLYWPGYLGTRLVSPFVVNSPGLGLALTTEWSAADGSVSAGLSGLQGFGVHFESLDFSSTGDARRVPLKSVTAKAAGFDLAPASGNAYRLSLLAEGLTMLPANGQAIPALDAEVRMIAQDFGSALGSDPAGAILAWLRKGGATGDFERFRLASGGAVLDAIGRLTLGADGLLSGTVQVRFRNPEAIARLAETLKPGSGEQVAQVLSILSAITVPVTLADGPARQTTLNLRNGVVSVGIIPVGSIPALRF